MFLGQSEDTPLRVLASATDGQFVVPYKRRKFVNQILGGRLGLVTDYARVTDYFFSIRPLIKFGAMESASENVIRYGITNMTAVEAYDGA